MHYFLSLVKTPWVSSMTPVNLPTDLKIRMFYNLEIVIEVLPMVSQQVLLYHESHILYVY